MRNTALPVLRSTVLLVDDAPENLRMLSEALRTDHRIMFAKNGQDALRLAAADPQPDIILLDVVMPGMNGYEICRRLKENPRTREIPVIIVTAENDDSDESTGFSLGAQDFIRKPFRASLVHQRVELHLELKRHRDHLSELVAQRTSELLQTQKATIHAMAMLAEWRDPETGAHIQRTSRLVEVLLRRLVERTDIPENLTSSDIEWIILSTPLHDVGKVAIPDNILHKPGRLSPEEFDIMKRHTTLGYEILEEAGQELDRELGKRCFLHYAREIALNHHERWDGKGYPAGLREEEIPLCARVVSVVDVYDALRSQRVYKDAYPHDVAVQCICEGRGKAFDPRVVDAFLDVQETFARLFEQSSGY